VGQPAVFPSFGCTKVQCDKDLDCSKRWKVKVFEDSANSANWHVERQTCSKGWTSKNGAAPQYDNIKDPDQYYQSIYHPSGNVTKTCWSCPAGPPMVLPQGPNIQYNY